MAREAMRHSGFTSIHNMSSPRLDNMSPWSYSLGCLFVSYTGSAEDRSSDDRRSSNFYQIKVQCPMTGYPEASPTLEWGWEQDGSSDDPISFKSISIGQISILKYSISSDDIIYQDIKLAANLLLRPMLIYMIDQYTVISILQIKP